MNRENFFKNLYQKYSKKEMENIQIAYDFAKDRHRNQKRDSGERYFEHCRRVTLHLINESANAVILGLIHDCEEDSILHPAIVKRLFGKYVACGSATLSKFLITADHCGFVTKTRKSDSQYFQGIASTNRIIKLVKLCDRIDNLKTSDIWDAQRRKRYIQETEKYLLPIARMTDIRVYNVLEKELMRVKQTIA